MHNKDAPCVQRAQTDAPLLRHIVNNRRTAEEDLQYHVEAHRTFRLFARLIELAENVLAKQWTGHFGSKRVRQLHRLLFEAQVADAREQRASLRGCEDALDVWVCGGTALDYFPDAIADYLDVPLISPSKTDELIAWLEGAS